MKRMKFAIGAIAFTVLACNQKVNKEVPQPLRVDIKKGEALFQAFNRHDWPAMAALYSPNALFLDPALGQYPITQTRDSIVAKYTALAAIVPDISDSLACILPCDSNRLMVEFVSKGTFPDGSNFRLPIVSILTFNNGLIIADHTYYDNSGGE
jgi:hypothetical protein